MSLQFMSLQCAGMWIFLQTYVALVLPVAVGVDPLHVISKINFTLQPPLADFALKPLQFDSNVLVYVPIEG